MGWKLPVVMTRAEIRTLQAFVDDAYGAPKRLDHCTKNVSDVLNPGLFESFALTHSGFHWIFDWSLSERSIGKPVPVTYPVWVLFLHSVVNGYGFSTQVTGSIVRSRLGNGSDDQIQIDIGEPSATERTLVARFANPSEAEVAWNAWCNTETSFNGPVEGRTTHDLIGEDIVFGLMEETVGFRLDEDSPRTSAFEAAQVM